MLFMNFQFFCYFFSPQRPVKRYLMSRLDMFFLVIMANILINRPSPSGPITTLYLKGGGFDTMTERGAPYGSAVEATS